MAPSATSYLRQFPYRVIAGLEARAADQVRRNFDAVLAEANPIGVLKAWAGASGNPIPAGWLLCDGRAVNRVQYQQLFAVVGTTYGAGDGSTTFNLPNMKGRTPFGQDTGQAEFTSIGQTGGNKAIVVGAVPGHTHGVNLNSGNDNQNHTHTLGGHTHGLNNHSHGGSTGFTEPPLHHHGSGSGSGFIVEIGSTVGLVGNPSIQASGPQVNTDSNTSINHNHPIGGDTSNTTGPSTGSDGESNNHQHNTTGNTDSGTGGGSAAGNMNPYVVMQWIMKA